MGLSMSRALDSKFAEVGQVTSTKNAGSGDDVHAHD